VFYRINEFDFFIIQVGTKKEEFENEKRNFIEIILK
jgi:hypothetical protein